MKSFPLIALAFVPLFLTGCAATRPISDLALGAGGAALGNELSHGNVAITAAGAAGPDTQRALNAMAAASEQMGSECTSLGASSGS